MRSVAVTPAPFSVRALILIGVLAAPMLLWPRMSFAFPPYLSAPLSPAYLVCTNSSFPGNTCNGYTVTDSPPPPNYQYSFIGYVYPTIPASKNFTVNPKYFIGSVFYVPPGAGASSIAYGAGTVTGTTMS